MHNPNHKGCFSVKEFLAWASIGRTTFYAHVAQGRLKIHKIGNKTVVTAANAQAWIDGLEEGGV